MAKSRFSRNKIQSYTMAGTEKGAQRIIERGATFKHEIKNQAVTLATGAAGTTGTISLKYSPIMNSTGAKLGAVGDTSLSFSGGLDNEVKYKFDLTDAEQFEEMSNGDYAIDYDTSEIRYKKKTADTSITVDYIKRTRDTELTVDGDVYVDNIKSFATDISDPSTQSYGLVDGTGHIATNLAKISGTETEVNSGNVSDGVQRITIATDDIPIALINTNLEDIETDIEATNTALGIVNTNLGTIETDIEATNTALGTVNTNLENIETDIEATNTALGTVNTNLEDIETDIEATNTLLTDVKTAVETIDDIVNIDDAAFTSGTSKGVALLGVNSTDTIDSGDFGAVKINTNRELEIAGYSSVTNSVRFNEVNPINLKYVTETLADVTNGDDGTYYYYVDMNGCRKLGLQLEGISGGSGTITITIEGTMQDDGTMPSSLAYQDISNDTFDSASWNADAMLIDNTEKTACYKYIRVKVVASTSGADDADWTIYSKRLY